MKLTREKQKTRNRFVPALLAAVMAAVLFACLPAVAHAASDDYNIDVEDLTADIGGTNWVYDHDSRTVTVSDDVTVTGFDSGVLDTLIMDIGAGATVSWEADLYGDGSFTGDLLVLRGSGSIGFYTGTLSTGNGNTVVVDGASTIGLTLGGASILSEGVYNAVWALGAGAGITLTGFGQVSAQGSGTAIMTGGVVTLTGGAVYAYEGTAIEAGSVTVWPGYPVYVGKTGATASPAILLDGSLTVFGGDLTINGDVNAREVYARGASSIKVDGNVDTTGDGIYAGVGSSIEVTGSVTAGGDGIVAATGSSIEVNGSVTAGGIGIGASTESNVKVTGNVTADSTGISTINSTIVVVDGNVDAGGTGIDAHLNTSVEVAGSVNAADNGIYTSNAASVKVGGNVDAGKTGIDALLGAHVEVGGDITAGGYGIDAGNEPIDAYDTAVDVVVNGSVTAGGYGIFASNTASVEVGGSVDAGSHGIYVRFNASVEVNGNVNARYYGIWIWNGNEVSVKVGGNLDAGSDGIIIYGRASVKVGSSVDAGQKGIYVSNPGSSVEVGGDVTASSGIDATGSSVEVGGSINAVGYGIGANTANVKVNGSVSAGDDWGILAINEASVEVNGNVTMAGDMPAAGVFCTEGSTVTVGGTITAPYYICLDSKYFLYLSNGDLSGFLTADDYDAISTKSGFLQYSGGNPISYVWVGGKSPEPETVLKLYCSTHVQSIGWQPFVAEGEVSGTIGQGLRLEGLKVNLENTTGYEGGIAYSTHVQNVGWQAPATVWTDGSSTAVALGDLSGTEGQGLRLEAVRMEVTGTLSQHYDIYYRVHAQSVGWMGWAKNGQDAGTAGLGLRLEAIQVCLVPHGGQAPADTYGGVSAPVGAPRMIDSAIVATGLRYKATVHVQNIGDITYSSANGIAQIGTSGQGLRLEAMTLWLVDKPEAGEIQYETHIQNIGWQGYKPEGVLSGTMGPGLRLEAVRIQLTDDMAANYDVYYRTHVQNIGWTGWAKNGQSCGSANFGYRMEAMQILIVPKGLAPGFNSDYFYQ